MDAGDGVEQELSARFRAGDMDAFRAVYETHAPRVNAITLRLSGDDELAEELAQEVFLRAWDRRRSLRNGDALGAWIRRIAVNLSLTRRRGDLRRLRRELRMPESWEAADTCQPDTDGVMDLESALRRLPRGARAVFVLHDLEGHTHREIGELLGIAEGTSKAHLHRAHTLLRKEVER